MKPLVLFVLAIITGLSVYSQENVKIKYHLSFKKVPYPAIIQNLTKENTYQLNLPQKLTHYGNHSQMQMDGMYFRNSYVKVKFTREAPQMYIAVIAPGISQVEMNGIKKTERGLVIDYTFQFPCRVEILDSNQRVLYSVPITRENETEKVNYYKNFSARGSLNFVPQYFITEKEISDYLRTATDIGKSIEKYAMNKAYAKIDTILTALYSDYAERHQLKWGEIADAKNVPEYVELNNAGKELDKAYDLLHDYKIEEATKILLAAKAIYEKYKDGTNPIIVPKVLEMVRYSLGWINILTNDTKAAQALYDQCIPSADWTTSYGWDEIDVMIQYATMRNSLKEVVGR
ncbi:hypothetical protein [Paraflavitalea sp. CAU 1676]|uniref:hypothetical protein n=1 Tax=Paraflavitalea sp. CAU 1676 TaxID=3032598 RepID=UPI0023DB179E|nr:hypothetical protein [Paraflavitalea sp. CAU 1676]MDF2190484.1 hypothetical protein [Paraflavitalea sp. CAU 1676]